LGNFFWNAELPTLQRLLLRGIVKSIQICYYNPANKSWETFDLNNPKHGDVCLLRIASYHHKKIGDKDPSLFSDKKGQIDPNSKPRPSLTLGRLRATCHKWRAYAQKKKKSHLI
jgi:hypothetical protein